MGIQLSPQIRKLEELMTHWCPGCQQRHYINTVSDDVSPGAPVWEFNGDATKPTFTPSVNIVGKCHYNITEGKIIYHGDSQHALAGQTVDLPDLPRY